jgi:hypothetical protein
MRAPRIIFLLGISLFFSACPLRASETIFGSPGQANPLDGENPFARPSLLGPAFTAVADDATALFSNPAGLAFLPDSQIMTNTDFWLVDSVDETLLWGFPAGRGLGFALGGQYLSFGSLNGYDESGTSTGTYGADRLHLEVGGGWEIFPQWGLGLEFQTDWSRLDETSDFDASWGVGILGALSPRFKIGASFNHGGLFSPGETLSSQTQAGLSYLWSLDSRQNLLAALGAGVEGGTDSFLQGGLEYGWTQSLFLRLGYRQALQDNGLGGLTGLTVGAGMVIGALKLDYAYLPQGDLGGSHRITVGYRFAAAAPGPGPTPVFWPPPLPPGSFTRAPTPIPPGLGATATPTPAGDSLIVESSVTVDPLVAGQGLEKEGKYTEAMKFYQSLAKDQPANASLWAAMGKLYAQFDRDPEAALCFRRALELKPGDPDILKWLQTVGGLP